jgi:hypothetical protein
MDKMIVYVDDAEHALHLISPMLQTSAPMHWILVACPPKLTQRISKWVSHSARQSWRARWADKLFGQIRPRLTDQKDQVDTLVAQEPLVRITQRLLAQHPQARVLDARRPKLGVDQPPVNHHQTPDTPSAWAIPGAMASLGAVMILAAE